MSDSDDTDVLLLIPPDFFFVAPSPSPASSPISISPPSPINGSLRRGKRISFAERQAVNSLKEITSQLKLIEERLSAVESQRNESMDDDNSCVWYDLDSYEADNPGYQSRKSRDNYRQSVNVKELLNASIRDSSSHNHPQDSSLTQSWGPSSIKQQYSQTPKHFLQQTDNSSRVTSHEDDDTEDESLRERRAASLPPSPSRNMYQTSPVKRASFQPRTSNHNRGMEASTRSASLGRAIGKMKSLGPERFERREFDDSFEKHRQGRTVKSSRETGNKVTRIDQRDDSSKKFSNEKFSQAKEDTISVQSNSFDGTLGMADLVPSMSNLGLSSSYAIPTSLEETKATDSSIDGGFTLSQVEKLLLDMQKTQAEMERSMRGMKNLRKNEKEDEKSESSQEDSDISSRKETKSSRQSLLPETEKRNIESERGGKNHGHENNMLDLNSKGFSNKSSKVPVRLVVEDRNDHDSRWRGSKDMERNLACGKVFPIYKSKSDESLSGKDKRPAEVSKNKCVGTESADDYFIRRPITPTRISGLGDTIGSVPDLGLGVREMFAKPSNQGQNTLHVPSKGSEKLRDNVKEPPFVKRNMYLVEKEENNQKTRESNPVPPVGNSKCIGTESEDEGCITGSKLAPSHVSSLGDTLGSVPDLGLGVRELFARTPEKRQIPARDPTKGSRQPQDPIKEPPITKKKMYLVGGENTDANTMKSNSVTFSGNNKCVGTESDDESRSTGGKLSSSHISNLGDTLGSVPDLGLGVRELFAKTPEKQRDPGKRPSKGSEKGRDVVKEPPCVKKKTWLLGSGSSSAQPMRDNLDSIDEGDPDLTPYLLERQEKLRKELMGWNEAIDAESASPVKMLQKQKNEVASPVVVVGGDGPRKIRRGWDGDRGGNRVGKRYAEDNMGPAEREEADEHKSRVYADRQARDQERYGQGSLDSRKDRYARYRDSGFGDANRSSFEAIRQMHSQKLFQTSGAWAFPSDMVNTAGPEVIIALRRKLEEEKFRREHCEQVIEEVGRRALEAQERLAVCEGMGKAKDVAIGKFHDAWEEAVAGWKKEGDASKELEKEIHRYRKRMTEELTFREKRLKQLEIEVVELGEESHFLREELRKGQRETADITARLSTMLEAATKEVVSCRKDAEDAIMRESHAREEASKACEASKEAKERMKGAVKKAEVLEAEKELMKQELEAQRDKLKDLICRIATLEKQLADAEIASDKATKSEKSLVENFAMAQIEWEKEKTKLKDFYQSQVEELVKTKVNEFQSQLDAVEQSLRKEVETREEDAKKLGEERLRMLNEKHTQEVNLLEQKHAEEISLWNLRLKRVMEEVDSLKQEVSKHNSQKAQLAKGLHSLMQAQLRQGLRLIASGGDVDQDAVLTPPKKIEKPTLETSWREIMSCLNTHDKADVFPEKEYHSKRFTDHSREKRLHSKERVDSEPLPSSKNKTSELPNSELKKYIHMLLGQKPGKPFGNREISSESDGDYEKQMQDSKSKQYLMKQMSRFGISGEEPRLESREKRRSKKERTKIAEKEDACKLTRDEPDPMWSTEGLTFDHLTSIPGGSEQSNIHENRRNRKPPWK